MIKAHVHDSLSWCSISQLMRIAIEAPKILSKNVLKEEVEVFGRDQGVSCLQLPGIISSYSNINRSKKKKKKKKGGVRIKHSGGRQK